MEEGLSLPHSPLILSPAWADSRLRRKKGMSHDILLQISPPGEVHHHPPLLPPPSRTHARSSLPTYSILRPFPIQDEIACQSLNAIRLFCFLPFPTAHTTHGPPSPPLFPAHVLLPTVALSLSHVGPPPPPLLPPPRSHSSPRLSIIIERRRRELESWRPKGKKEEKSLCAGRSLLLPVSLSAQ